MSHQPSMRDKVIEEARTWIRTPYHSGAGIKGAGVDCGMLLVRVYCDLGLVPPIELPRYTQDWYLHREEDWALELFLHYTVPIETIDRGDVILFKYGRAYSHGVIISCVNPLTIIHASYPCGIVLEEEISFNNILVNRLSSAKKATIIGL